MLMSHCRSLVAYAYAYVASEDQALCFNACIVHVNQPIQCAIYNRKMSRVCHLRSILHVKFFNYLLLTPHLMFRRVQKRQVVPQTVWLILTGKILEESS